MLSPHTRPRVLRARTATPPETQMGQRGSVRRGGAGRAVARSCRPRRPLPRSEHVSLMDISSRGDGWLAHYDARWLVDGRCRCHPRRVAHRSDLRRDANRRVRAAAALRFARASPDGWSGEPRVAHEVWAIVWAGLHFAQCHTLIRAARRARGAGVSRERGFLARRNTCHERSRSRRDRWP